MIETNVNSPTTQVINLHPTANDLAKAYLDLINEWGWQGFTILYEDTPWLPIIDVVMRNYTDKYTVAVRQLDMTKNGNYRPILNQVKQFGDKNIVICSSIEKLEEILRQAQQVGLLSDEHQVLITNLDMHTIDLEPFQYSGTNITGLRIINPNDDYVIEMNKYFKDKLDSIKNVETDDYNDENESSEMTEKLEAGNKMRIRTALTVDAVMLIVNAVRAISKNHTDIFRQTPIDCDDSNSLFSSGTSFINFMRSVEPFKGLTGNIEFGEFGNRSNFNLEVLELVSEGLKKVGMWNSKKGLETYRDKQMIEHDPKDVFKGKNLIVLTVDVSLNFSYKTV